MYCRRTLSIQLDTQSIRIFQSTEEDGKTLFFKITMETMSDFYLTLGRPTQELLPEQEEEQVEGGRGRGRR